MANTSVSATPYRNIEMVDDNEYDTRHTLRQNSQQSELLYNPQVMQSSLQQQQQQFMQQQQQQQQQFMQQQHQQQFMPMQTGPRSNALVIATPNAYAAPIHQQYNPAQPPYYTPPVQPPVQPPAPSAHYGSITKPPTDHIQLLVDERQYKGQINSKLDTVVAKVEQLFDRVGVTFGRDPVDVHVSSGISAKAILQTIQTVVVHYPRQQFG
jgi:type II secretory pathway pseudopilin PulG